MDSTPASHRSRTKLVSRLMKLGDLEIDPQPTPKLSANLVDSPSNVSVRSSNNSLPLQELLLLSPSPYKRSKTWLANGLEMAAADEGAEPVGPRKRCKSRGLGLSGCRSPRSTRRSRRRPEAEPREERDSGFGEEMGNLRRRRKSGRSRKEKLTLVPVVTTSSSLSRIGADEGFDNANLDLIGEAITDLIMWRDAAKSTLWFGIGSLGFLSSCFAKGINFSIFAAVCQLGLLFLGLSFISNSISQRNNVEKRRDVRLREDDILRAARLILPAANLLISKTRELFSGEPSMTLKVAPFLLLGAEYGHLLTTWRICAIGFFMSFTAPKLYSRYSLRISQKVESVKLCVTERWCACSHKKIVAASAAMAFWNLSTIKTRVLTAFISVVILRYCRQNSLLKLGGAEGVEREQLGDEQLQQALVVAERKSTEQSRSNLLARGDSMQT